jgi:hypothetical protein
VPSEPQAPAVRHFIKMLKKNRFDWQNFDNQEEDDGY